MNIDAIVQENYNELAETAAQVGIDFSKCYSLIDASNQMVYVAPLKQKHYKKTCMSSNIYGNTLVVTFFTYAHGKQSVTWKFTPGQKSKINIPRYLKVRASKEQHKKDLIQANREIQNRQYINDYKLCNTWVDDCKYLKEKSLSGKVRVKQMSDHHGKFLALPIVHPTRNIVGLLRIYDHKVGKSDTNKLFTPGIDRKGGYILVGEDLPDTQEVMVCEGWADGVSLNLSLGLPVYVALDCNGLHGITKMLREKYCQKQIILTADDDRWDPEKGNPGLRAAVEVSYFTKVKVRRPYFDDAIIPVGEKPKDFNDLYRLKGPKEVAKQIRSRKGKYVVKSPTNAYEYNLELLKYTPKSSMLKQLKIVIAKGIRCDLPLRRMKEQLLELGVHSEDIDNTYQQSIYKAHARVRRLHTISRKNDKVIRIPLDLVRQAHGGYLISDGQFEKIRYLNGIIIIKSPMASAKTEKLIKEGIDSSESAAYLAHRVALVEEACERLGLMSYQGAVEADVRNKKKVGVCVNSLAHDRFQGGTWFENVDTIFIDEASKVIEHLCGSTIEDKERVMETFLSIVENSKKVVLCDADASDNLIDIISNRVPDRKIYLLEPSDGAPMDHINVDLTTSMHEGYQKVFSDAAAQKKVLVGTDSKKIVKVIARKLTKQGFKVLAIHSESRTTPEVNAWIKNPNQESLKYDVVVYNSCIDSGVSIVTDHFDTTVGIFTGIVNPDTVKQMMGRNRTSRDWFLVAHPHYKTVFCNTEESMYRALATSHCKVMWDQKNNAAVPMPNLSDYDHVKFATKRREFLSKCDYILTLQLMLEQDGYKVKRLYSEHEHQTTLEKDMKELGKKIQEEFVESILNTEAPSSSQYRRLKDSYAISEEQYAQVIRYEIEAATCKKKLTESDVLFWTKGGKRKIFLLETLLTDIEKLNKYDKFEINTIKSLSLRRYLQTKYTLLKGLFDHLGVDLKTGEGDFSHNQVMKFIKWLYENKNRLDNWNEHKLGPFLAEKPPKIPMIFAQEVFNKLGLKTTRFRKTAKNLSYHKIDKSSWQNMAEYLKLRSDAGKNVSNLPENPSVYKENVKDNIHTFQADNGRKSQETNLNKVENDDDEWMFACYCVDPNNHEKSCFDYKQEAT